MPWSEESRQNPVITFPIKKRINTELFISKSAAIYMQKGARIIRAKEKRVKLWGRRTTIGRNEKR